MLFRVQLPQLLDPDTERLGIAILPQAEFFEQCFRQGTADTFREQSVFGMQFHTRLVRAFMLTIPANPHVSGCNSLNAAIFMVQDFSRREPRVDFDFERLSLLREPTAKISETDNIVSMIM